jgi:hypothetical protein
MSTTTRKKFYLEVPSSGVQFTLVHPTQDDVDFIGYNVRKLRISRLDFETSAVNDHGLMKIVIESDAGDFNKYQHYDGTNDPFYYFKCFYMPKSSGQMIHYINESLDYWDYCDPKQENLVKNLTIYVLGKDDATLDQVQLNNKLYMELEIE